VLKGTYLSSIIGVCEAFRVLVPGFWWPLFRPVPCPKTVWRIHFSRRSLSSHALCFSKICSHYFTPSLSAPNAGAYAPVPLLGPPHPASSPPPDSLSSLQKIAVPWRHILSLFFHAVSCSTFFLRISPVAFSPYIALPSTPLFVVSSSFRVVSFFLRSAICTLFSIRLLSIGV